LKLFILSTQNNPLPFFSIFSPSKDRISFPDGRMNSPDTPPFLVLAEYIKLPIKCKQKIVGLTFTNGGVE
jgi:hypothetical protein